LPDWVTHLGTTYLAAQAAQKFRRLPEPEMRPLLTGALLPDATRFTIILVDILDWSAIPTFTYLIPFHSLLIVGFMAGALALLLSSTSAGSWRTFGWLMVGASLHFLLDEFDGEVGCGSTFLYPFYFGKLFKGWASEDNMALFLLVISAMALGVALTQRHTWARLCLYLTRWRMLGAGLCMLIAVLLPLFFGQWMIERNAYYLGFATNPAIFEGREVEFCFSEVIATQPPTIEEFDRAFILPQDSANFTLGEWVSVRGVYREGMIWPSLLVHHRSFSDVVVSLVAAVAFVVLMIDRSNIAER
jgi:hypothetical protein